MVENKKGMRTHLLDWFILLLNITYGMSMLKVWIIDPFPIPFNIPIITITLIAYFYRFGTKVIFPSIMKNHLLFLFIIIYLIDIIQNILFFDADAVSDAVGRTTVFVSSFLLMLYVYALYKESQIKSEDPLSVLSKPYEFFAVYNIIVVVLCAVLIYIGVLSATNNPMPPNSLTEDNQVRTGADYYFPGYLSLAIGQMRGLSFFNIPVLTGLTHEPHVLLLLIGPAFFLLLGRVKDKTLLTIFLYIALLFVLVITTSTTAIISFIICLAIEEVYSLTLGKNKFKHILVIVLYMAFIIAMMSSIMNVVVDDTLQVVGDKLDAGTEAGSMGFSYSMLYYMVSPQSFFGRGNIPSGSGMLLDMQDIGLVSCILDICFFIMMFYKAFRFIFSKDNKMHVWGMAILYFLLHMQKLSVLMFRYQYLAFFVIIVVIMDDYFLLKKNSVQY